LQSPTISPLRVRSRLVARTLVLVLLGACSSGRLASDADRDSGPKHAGVEPADLGGRVAGRGEEAGQDDTPMPGAEAGSTARDASVGSTDASQGSTGPCPGPAPSDFAYGVESSYFGRKDYIEYLPGNLPIIISAPHGGTLAPAEIPAQPGDEQDGGSQEYARLLHAYLRDLTGRTPHLIINHLTRNRLEANSDQQGASYGNTQAAEAWEDYHAFTDAAKAWVTSACGRGHYFDLHTNGHDEGWVEMGLALNGSELNLSDAELDTQVRRERSTLRALASSDGIRFIEIIRGPTSLGGLLEAAGVKAVPSPTYPGPGEGGYYNGGYNVRRHGSSKGGVIDATQIESHFNYVNSGATKREAYTRKLAQAIHDYMTAHYGFDLDAP